MHTEQQLKRDKLLQDHGEEKNRRKDYDMKHQYLPTYSPHTYTRKDKGKKEKSTFYQICKEAERKKGICM